jgi:putative CocE/NonD family hydrolase
MRDRRPHRSPPRFARLLSSLVLLLALLPAAPFVAPLAAQGGRGGRGNLAPDDTRVRAFYEKRELRIRMRDGVTLFTSIYLPRDTSRSYPIMLSRTPYGVAPYGDAYKTALGPSPTFERDKFIFVYQDVRGRYMSDGTFENVAPVKWTYSGSTDVDDATDTYDAIDWLVKNLPHNNGRVGMWGISYPGGYAEVALINSHPALKAVSPQAPVSDWGHGDDWHDNGAFRLPHAFGFLAGFDWPHPGPITTYPPRMQMPTQDGYAFYLEAGSVGNLDSKYFNGTHPYWNELLKHPNYDQFWKDRNLLAHLKDVKPAVMTTGGWYDNQNLFGALQLFKHIEAQSPNTVNSLVFGPWVHGGWARGEGENLGDVHFGSATSPFYQDSIEYPFFAFYLKGIGTASPTPKAYVFQTGSNRWQKLDAWPPKSATSKSLYLLADGKLSFDPPAAGGAAYDEYVSDPAKPVPYTKEINSGMTSTYASEDQRFAATRPDVLVYGSGVLDRDVSIAGPMTASLWVSTSGTDSDWIVKLIDVYPANTPDAPAMTYGEHLSGFEQLVRANAMRGRFRESFETPRPMTAGQPVKLEFAMNDINHTFKAGHRIMVQVQSTWFPIMDRNTQNYVPNIELAKDSDFRKATERVYHTAAMASAIKVLVAP